MDSDIPKQYYPTIKQSFGLILKLIGITILLGIPFGILSMILEASGLDKKYIDNIGYNILYIILFIILTKSGLDQIKKTGRPNYQLKFNKIKIKTIIISILVLISGIFIIEPVENLIPMPDAFRDYMQKFIQPNFFSFLEIVVTAPILEELFFRGIILEGFLKNYSPKKAIIWSAVIFGLAHLNPWQAIGATLIGILIGWIYWRTKSLLPGIFIHFTNNLLVFILTFTTDSNVDSFYELFNNWMIYGIVFLIALGIFIGGIYLLEKNLDSTYPNSEITDDEQTLQKQEAFLHLPTE